MPALPSDAHRHSLGEHRVPHRPCSELPTSARVAAPRTPAAAGTKQSCPRPVWALLPASLARMRPLAKGHLPASWEHRGHWAKCFKPSLWSVQHRLPSTAHIHLWGTCGIGLWKQVWYPCVVQSTWAVSVWHVSSVRANSIIRYF